MDNSSVPIDSLGELCECSVLPMNGCCLRSYNITGALALQHTTLSWCTVCNTDTDGTWKSVSLNTNLSPIENLVQIGFDVENVIRIHLYTHLVPVRAPICTPRLKQGTRISRRKARLYSEENAHGSEQSTDNDSLGPNIGQMLCEVGFEKAIKGRLDDDLFPWK